MKIPKKIRIGGHDINVGYVDRLPEDKLGQICLAEGKIAKTNQYKLAGNSIVVSPMYHIFRKLFIDKENEREQLELF